MLKQILMHGAGGIAAGWLVAAGLLYLDIAALGTLILGSETPVLALTLLLTGLGVTFGSVAMGAAIMMQPYDDPATGRRR